jgi:hypothetical protein
VTFYDLLGVPARASHAEMRRAFVHLARQAHPDVHATADVATRRAAEERMRRLNEAWAVLGDPERRRRYDEELEARRASASRAAPSGGRAASAPPPWSGPSGAGPERAGGPGSGFTAPSGPSSTDWRRYASPGPAVHRSTAARLIAVAPPGFLFLALLLLGAGALLRAPGLVTMAAVTAVVAALAFLAAPILAMKEARRGQRRPARRPVHPFDSRGRR